MKRSTMDEDGSEKAPLRCRVRDALAERYRVAAMRFGACARAVKDAQGTEFLTQKIDAEAQARIERDKARKALEDHRAEHGC